MEPPIPPGGIELVSLSPPPLGMPGTGESSGVSG